jgi:hypothetical protein
MAQYGTIFLPVDTSSILSPEGLAVLASALTEVELVGGTEPSSARARRWRPGRPAASFFQNVPFYLMAFSDSEEGTIAYYEGEAGKVLVPTFFFFKSAGGGDADPELTELISRAVGFPLRGYPVRD